MALDVNDRLAGIALEPAPVEVLGDRPELDEEVVGEIFRLDLAALLAPEAQAGEGAPRRARVPPVDYGDSSSRFDPNPKH